MRLIDWAAVLGALAWIPHLLKFVVDVLKRPEVRIIAAKNPEIGFTTFGAIFNLRVAFVVTKRDVVISGLRVRIRHNDGEERVFSWQGVVQAMGRLVHPEAGNMPFEKESNVLAIKIGEKDADERSVRFQETLFVVGKKDLEEKASKKGVYLRRKGEFDPQRFLAGEEMTDVYSFVKRSFGWKEGRYSIQFVIESPHGFKIRGDKYEFTLSAVDVEELETNKQQIERDYRYRFLPKAEGDPEIVWVWRYPDMTPRI